MGKHFFTKFFCTIFLLLGISAYAYFFPTTMELLDETVNDIFSPEKRFSFFNDFSGFTKKTVNTAIYYIEIIKNNLEDNFSSTTEVPLVIFSCLGKFPTQNTVITSDFGKREHPVYGSEDFHTGIDIAAANGADVNSAWPGTVIEIGNDKIYGKYVIVEHGLNFLTKYCHLSKITVIKDDFILAEEKLGEVGSTGLSTGNHLHFEIYIDGRNIDPITCLEI